MQNLTDKTTKYQTGLSLKDKYRLCGSGYTIQEQLDALHSLAKELKAISRASISDKVKGIKRIDNDRPDLQAMK